MCDRQCAHRLEEAGEQVRANDRDRVLGFIWVDLNNRQLVHVVRSVYEFAPVDELDRAVAIVIHPYAPGHELRQR
jgi:hypothetical protein